MADLIKVKTTGLPELQAVLRQLPDATARNVLRRVGKTVLEPVAATARQLAPKEWGDLEKTITVSSRLSKSQRAKHKSDDRDSVRMYVGAGNVQQSYLQEFGTVHHPAQPFMRPAWDQHHMEVFHEIGKALWVEIQKATARLARKAAKQAAKGASGGS
jgi:HK97 gp10 family phage protein